MQAELEAETGSPARIRYLLQIRIMHAMGPVWTSFAAEHLHSDKGVVRLKRRIRRQ